MTHDVLYMAGIEEQGLDAIVEKGQRELERRERAYRAGMPPVDVEGRIVILVDDGLATGATMLAAAKAIRKLRPQRLIVAVPVAAPETCNYFRRAVDEIVCAETPRAFQAVGLWYEDFSQTSDDEVRDLLARANRQRVHQE